MKERPILFSAPMVRAILDGRKTMTRRALNPQPDGGIQFGAIATPHGVVNGKGNPLVCRYGKPGDRLWVRETWMADPSCDDDAWDDHHVSWREWDGCGCRTRDIPTQLCKVENVIHKASWDGIEMVGWKPSIHMPRWASRILLEVTGVRVERLQDISEEDAIAEGVESLGPPENVWTRSNGEKRHWRERGYRSQAECLFSDLWKSISGAESWDSNPWVWVIEFKVLQS